MAPTRGTTTDGGRQGRRRRPLLTAAATLLPALFPHAVSAAGACTPIAALPYAIVAPGVYCLRGDVAYGGTGTAVRISASDVVLDLSGFTLRGTAGPAAQSVGIYAEAARGVAVRNGTVTGFHMAVQLLASGSVVEDITASGNWQFGIWARGADGLIRRCQVSATGGSLLPGATIPVGIQGLGDRVRVLDNLVSDTRPPPRGEAVGIALAQGVGARAERNLIINPWVSPNTWGIWLTIPVAEAVLDRNVIVRYETGIAFPGGTAGEYRGNTFLGVPRRVIDTSLLAVDGGGNQHSAAPCDPILSLPNTIVAEGTYCLIRNLSTKVDSGAAITIEADSVVLDLEGFKIGGGAAGPATRAVGVYALNRRNVTVINGNVRGFLRGVFLEDSSGDFSASQGHLVAGVRADGNTLAGIQVQGRGNVVRGNQVVGTTGTMAFAADVDTYGILMQGPGARVRDNDVTDTAGMGSGSGTAIGLREASGAMVERNRLGNSAPGSSFGVRAVSGTDVIIVGNRIASMGAGVVYDAATGSYRDNLTNGVAIPYVGGTDMGNNH